MRKKSDHWYAGDELREHWERLHHGDREPWPDERLIAKLGKSHRALAGWIDSAGGAAEVATGLQNAWREFHAGEFRKAIQIGSALGALGAAAANKAAAVHSLYSRPSESSRINELEAAATRGEAAVKELPESANAHYTLALVLGRYSQRISILKALAEGLGGRVQSHLQLALEAEPRHAEAHIALGLYNAEIVGKLGSIAASLTYGATHDAAIRHFQTAIKLAPSLPIALMEYGNGLLLLDADRNREEARKLYAKAASCKPADAMEQLDVERAKRGID